MPKTMFNGQEVEYVEYIPSWEAVLPIYLTAYENGNRSALAELTRMAKSLDEKNEHVKEFSTKLTELNEENNILRKKLHDLEKQLEASVSENEMRKKVNTALVRVISDHARKDISYQDRIRSLESRLNDLETELEYFRNAQE